MARASSAAVPRQARGAGAPGRPRAFFQRMGNERSLWIGIALLALLLFAWGIPERAAGLRAYAETYQRPLRLLSLTPTLYVFYVSALDVVIVLAHALIALLILWRRPRPQERMALLVALALVTAPLAATHALGANHPVGRLLTAAVIYVALVTSLTLLYLFPDGRFVPQWTRAPTLLWAAIALPAAFLPAASFSFQQWPVALQWLALVGLVGSSLYAQLFRYRHVSSKAQREQTRWATFGLAAAAFAPLGYFFPFVTLPSLGQSPLPTLFYQLAGPPLFTMLLLARLVGFTLFTLLLLLFPLSFAIAIRRDRLWEINLLLNRTLVYGALTTTLLLFYLLNVVLLQTLFRRLTGEGQSQLVTVVSTLAIATLFNPLRHRIQAAIDHRFFRKKYDAQQTLAAFSASLRERQNAELEHLTGEVLAVIHETMKPATLSIWLREEKKE